jgi:hypothetical protein
MISAMEWSAIQDDAKAVGVDTFLAKPLFPSSIADLINEALGSDSPPETDETQSDTAGIFDGQCLPGRYRKMPGGRHERPRG